MALDILIVDDENDIRELVSGILTDEEYSARTAASVLDALELIKERNPDLIILDVWLGEGERDGMRLLEIIKNEYPHITVIMMSGHGTIDTAVLAIKKGAYDFIEKPFDSNRLITSVKKAIEAATLKQENEELRIKACMLDSIVGESQNISHIKQTIGKIAPLNGRCIIIGPAGSDKESIAREIHKNSQRSKNHFSIINCTAYPPKQIEIELFGIQVTGESNSKIIQGAIEKANYGTVFINEINSLPNDVQLKILKMMKEDSFTRIGSSSKIPHNIRLIAGASQEIFEQVKNNSFNEELFYRLSAHVIKIDPLCSRKIDIPILLNNFMNSLAKSHSVLPRKFSNEAMGVLISYSWPGDILQLKNFIDWILVSQISKDSNGIISIEDLPKEITEEKTPNNSNNTHLISRVCELSIKEARETFEREYFIEQLKKFSWNISQTSKFVGMERSALHRKLKSLNISDIKRTE